MRSTFFSEQYSYIQKICDDGHTIYNGMDNLCAWRRFVKKNIKRRPLWLRQKTMLSGTRSIFVVFAIYSFYNLSFWTCGLKWEGRRTDGRKETAKSAIRPKGRPYRPIISIDPQEIRMMTCNIISPRNCCVKRTGFKGPDRLDRRDNDLEPDQPARLV